LAFRAAIELVAIAHEKGDRGTHDDWLAKARERATVLRRPRAWWRLLVAESRRFFLVGDLDQAETLGRDALAWAPSDPIARTIYAGTELAAVRLRGRLAERVADIEGQLPNVSPADQLRLARILADAGRLDLAHAVYAARVANGFDLPRDPTFGSSLVMLAYLCALLGDGANAGYLLERLEPYADRMFVGVEPLPTVAHYLAMLSATSGHVTEAQSWFERAVTLHESVGAVLFAAESRLEWARLCHAIGVADRARVLAEQARSAAGAHHAEGIEAQAQALLAVIDTPPRPYGESVY